MLFTPFRLLSLVECAPLSAEGGSDLSGNRASCRNTSPPCGNMSDAVSSRHRVVHEDCRGGRGELSGTGSLSRAPRNPTEGGSALPPSPGPPDVDRRRFRPHPTITPPPLREEDCGETDPVPREASTRSVRHRQDWGHYPSWRVGPRTPSSRRGPPSPQSGHVV